MGTITLSDTQQRQVRILQRLVDATLTAPQAAQLLGKSVRQIRRLKKAFVEKGMAAVKHGNTGREPKNKTAPEVLEKLRELAGPQGVYRSYNTSHLAEVLAREHDLALGRATLDRLLVLHGLRKRSQPTERVARKRRTRRQAEGAMLQLDGSLHRWLGEKQAALCLLGAIDDATGKIIGLLFRPTEDQAGYLTLLRQIAVEYGLPESVYHDKHTILRSPKEATLEEELAGKPPRSQVQAVLELLGIEAIAAHSPQAKGRIERLWGTLQDRLSQELQTAQITTLEAAQAFLPAFIARFNQTFARPAGDPEPVWVALEAGMDRDYYFSTRQTRTVKSDHTLSYEGKILQLLPERGGPSLKGKQVQVHQVPEGNLFVYFQKERIAHKALSAPPPKPTPLPAPDPKSGMDPEKKKASRQRQMAHLYASG